MDIQTNLAPIEVEIKYTAPTCGTTFSAFNFQVCKDRLKEDPEIESLLKEFEQIVLDFIESG
jgi:hypothetical protein